MGGSGGGVISSGRILRRFVLGGNFKGFVLEGGGGGNGSLSINCSHWEFPVKMTFPKILKYGLGNTSF